MRTKTAREIKVTNNLLKNKKITAKIGTPKNRNEPETVYISISFWTKPSELYEGVDRIELRNILKKEIKNLYKDLTQKLLLNNKIFNRPKDNFFIENIPENINYNNKRNFINFELYLHTCNIDENMKLPLSQKPEETQIYDETIKIINFFGESEILNGEKGFYIFNKNR